jgi:hypothetical protein
MAATLFCSLCKFAGAQAICHCLSGKNLSSLDNMYMLSTLFEMSIDDILRGNK